MELLKDDHILLLSWTQLAAVLMLDPENEEYATAQQEITMKLDEEYRIIGLQLLARSFDGYTIAYEEKGEGKITTFSLEEAEELL